MYTLNTTAVGVLNGFNKQWENIDLTAFSVQALLAQYRIVQITLTVPAALEPVYLLLSDIASTYSSYSGTFQQLLSDLGNASLPTSTSPIKIGNATARFYDAFALRYTFKVVDSTNAELPVTTDESHYNDLRIDRADQLVAPNVLDTTPVPIAGIYNAPINSANAVINTLVNINGFYHLAENIGNQGIFVKDGLKSMRLANQANIGLWDFNELGGFSVLATVPGAVDSSGSAFQVRFTQDVSASTVFFVIAGYFFPVDGTVVSQVGARVFQIDFAHVNMRLAARYFEAAGYIDLSAVAAAAGGATAGTIDTSLLDKAPAIAAWMALSQTFAVIVNRKDCYMQMRYVQRTENPNKYFCYLDRDLSNVPNEIENPRLSLVPPKLPLVLGLGRHAPYWTTTENWVHSLTVASSNVDSLMPWATPPAVEGVSSLTNQAKVKRVLQNAYLLEFGSAVGI